MASLPPLPIPFPLSEIQAAGERIKGKAIRMPLVRLYHDDFPGELYLKLENLQPIGSFKIRGASSAMAVASRELISRGVYTASAGNMAQGVAWVARTMGISCTVVVPDHAPQTKLDAITRLGGTYVKLPFDQWWQVLATREYEGMKGLFVHPVSDPPVIAGNGTIGLEILDDLPDVDTVIVPYGGGGLTSGIASAIKALKPDTSIYCSETSTAAPLSKSLEAGSPQKIEYIPSFIDGIGGVAVLAEMWPLVRSLVSDSIVVTPEEIAKAIKLLVQRNRIVAEGAGGSSVAAALTGKAGHGRIVCIISGGNIDAQKIARILNDEVP
jgi:threonine dehydratase